MNGPSTSQPSCNWNIIFYRSLKSVQMFLCWVGLILLYSNNLSTMETISSSFLILSFQPFFFCSIKRNLSLKPSGFSETKVVVTKTEPDSSNSSSKVSLS